MHPAATAAAQWNSYSHSRFLFYLGWTKAGLMKMLSAKTESAGVWVRENSPFYQWRQQGAGSA